jgi:hypothetical protein
MQEEKHKEIKRDKNTEPEKTKTREKKHGKG